MQRILAGHTHGGPQKNEIQPLIEHCRIVGDLCGNHCKVLGLFHVGRLTGWLHDVGKSGWMLLAGLVPIIGSLYLLYLFCLDSNDAGDEYDSSAPYFPYDD